MGKNFYESIGTLEMNRLEPATPDKVLITHAATLRSVSNQNKMLHKENADYMNTLLEDQRCHKAESQTTRVRG